jgi:hypothetical protein
MVVHVLQQQLVIFANVHGLLQDLIVKHWLLHQLLDQFVLVLFVHVQHPLLQ